jgi:hypothetical protein
MKASKEAGYEEALLKYDFATRQAYDLRGDELAILREQLRRSECENRALRAKVVEILSAFRPTEACVEKGGAG